MAWQQLSERLHERRLGYLGMYMVPGTVPGMYMVPGTYNILNAYLPRYTRTSGDIDQSDLLRLLLIRKLETVGPLVKNSAMSRHQAQSMFEELDVGASHEQATRLMGANQRASAADLDRLFRVPSTADLHERVSLRGSLPAHR